MPDLVAMPSNGVSAYSRERPESAIAKVMSLRAIGLATRTQRAGAGVPRGKMRRLARQARSPRQRCEERRDDGRRQPKRAKVSTDVVRREGKMGGNQGHHDISGVVAKEDVGMYVHTVRLRRGQY